MNIVFPVQRSWPGTYIGEFTFFILVGASIAMWLGSLSQGSVRLRNVCGEPAIFQTPQIGLAFPSSSASVPEIFSLIKNTHSIRQIHVVNENDGLYYGCSILCVIIIVNS